MTAKETKDFLEDGFSEYAFEYKGKSGTCPIYTSEGTIAFYDNKEFPFKDYDELMDIPFLDGKSLNEAAEDVIWYG